MFSKIVAFIIEYRHALLNPLLLLMAVLLIGSISKGRRFPWISLVLFTASAGLYAGRIFVYWGKQFRGYDVIIYIAALMAVSCLVEITEFTVRSIRFHRIIRIISSMPSNIESSIYAYLDAKSNLLAYTSQFYHTFENEKPKSLLKKISHIVTNEKEMSVREFQTNMKSYEEKNLRANIILKNGNEYPFEILKRKVISRGKLLGYVLINQKTMVSEMYKDTISRQFRERLFRYFSLLEEPLSYYDTEKKKYILSDDFAKALGLTENEIEESQFAGYVFEDDRKIYAKRNITDSLSKNYYRLITLRGTEWFEENGILCEDGPYIVIHRTEFVKSKFAFRHYSYLEADIRTQFQNNGECALIYLSLTNMNRITESAGTASNLILAKYFSKITETIPGIKTYRIQDAEYALLIEKQEMYDMILQDLANGNSILLAYSVFFNETKYELSNRIGLAESKKLNAKTAPALMKAANEALRFAKDPAYSKQYSIYVPAATDEKPISSAAIDLSDDFLDKILSKK